MKKRVSRIEAIIIMKAAKEFRDKQALETPVLSEIVVPEPVAIPEPKKSLISYLVDFFRKKRT